MKTNHIGWSSKSKNFTQRYLKAEKIRICQIPFRTLRCPIYLFTCWKYILKYHQLYALHHNKLHTWVYAFKTNESIIPLCIFISVHKVRVHSPFRVNPAHEIKILYDDLHIHFYGLSTLQWWATTLTITANLFLLFLSTVSPSIFKKFEVQQYIYIYHMLYIFSQ